MKNLNVNEKVMVELSTIGVTMWKRHAFNTSQSFYSDPDLKNMLLEREMSKLNNNTLETTLWEIMGVYGPYIRENDPDLYPFKSGIKIKEKSLIDDKGNN